MPIRLASGVPLLGALLIASSTVVTAWPLPHALAAPPPKPAAKAQALPVPQELRLSNGLKVLLVERHDLPLVRVDVVFRAGQLYEPAGKGGLASLTAQLLTKGTTTRSAGQIAEEIDFVGGALSADAGADMATVGLSVLKKDLNTGLSLLGDVLAHPAFAPEEVERLKEQAKARLLSSLDDADAVVAAAYDRAIFGEHPYGRANVGTEASLASLSREDVVAFHQARFRPDGAFAVVVGDVTRSEVEARFAQTLAGWTGKVSNFEGSPPPVPLAGKQVTLVDMDVTQSYVMWGARSFKRRDPDYYATSLMVSILGGGMTSRLFSEVRDKQGLAYGVWSSNQMYLTSGTLGIGLQTKTASTRQALESVQRELARMAKDGVTAKELADAKSSMLGYFPLGLEANPDLARTLMRMEFYGLGSDYLSRYRERIQAVDREAIRRMARKYLPSGDYALVVVAPAAAVEKDLAAFGPVRKVARRDLIAR